MIRIMNINQLNVIDMKRFIIVLLLICVSVFSTHAQSTSRMADGSTVKEYLQEVVKNKSFFKGKPVQQFYDMLKKDGFPINHMSTESVGPWTEEEVRGVILYTETSEKIDEGKPTFIVTIDFEGECGLDYDFWHSLPDHNWMDVILDRTKNMTFWDVSYEYTRIRRKRK